MLFVERLVAKNTANPIDKKSCREAKFLFLV